MTLVELVVALAFGSFLMIGAIQVYNQSRQTFVINESIARVQETAQFADGNGRGGSAHGEQLGPAQPRFGRKPPLAGR